jgi:hypothetical protein
MKPIDQMNLAELAEIMAPYSDLKERIINRLRVIHEETRWIPVSERMPNNEEWVIVYSSFADMALYDGDCGVFLRWGHGVIPNVTHWRIITPPEGV